MSYIYSKTLFLSTSSAKCGSNNYKVFKELKSIDILNIIDLINNIL